MLEWTDPHWHFPNGGDVMKEKRQGYVYVLHFDSPICETHTCQHYIGCTCDLRQRLITHAQGRGARLTEVAKERGITWQLAALGTTHVTGMRRIERQLKDWHGVKGQCSLCTESPRTIPGTVGYPLESIPFPLDSARLARLGATAPRIVYGFTGAASTIRTVNDLTRLMQMNKWALGFIPCGGDEGLTISVAMGRVAVCYIDDVLAGYCAFTEPLDKSCVRIQQCCVDDSQRGCGIGRTLVNMVCDARPGVPVHCKVRDELVANAFWQAIGFSPDGFETHPTSGQRLNKYTLNPKGEAC
jgi:predicted GIY-YIG superfamily endonuclease